MFVLDSVQTTDNFPADGSSGGAMVVAKAGSSGGFATVKGADVYVSIAYSPRDGKGRPTGILEWTPEVHVAPGGINIFAGTRGIRFRSYLAGTPATVSVGLSEPVEPPLSLAAAGDANAGGGGFDPTGFIHYHTSSIGVGDNTGDTLDVTATVGGFTFLDSNGSGITLDSEAAGSFIWLKTNASGDTGFGNMDFDATGLAAAISFATDSDFNVSVSEDINLAANRVGLGGRNGRDVNITARRNAGVTAMTGELDLSASSGLIRVQHPAGNLLLPSLPTSDPGVAGAAWDSNGDVVLSGFINSGAGWDNTIVKPSDTSRASTIVLAVDPALVTPALVAGAMYAFYAFIIYNSPVGVGTPDFKFTIGEDAATRGLWNLQNYFDTSDTIRTAFSALTVIGAGGSIGTAADLRVATIWGWHVANGGSLSLYWSQDVSSVNATVVKAKSVLSYRRVA